MIILFFLFKEEILSEIALKNNLHKIKNAQILSAQFIDFCKGMYL